MAENLLDFSNKAVILKDSKKLLYPNPDKPERIATKASRHKQ
jgi:hypothetical protein